MCWSIALKKQEMRRTLLLSYPLSRKIFWPQEDDTFLRNQSLRVPRLCRRRPSLPLSPAIAVHLLCLIVKEHDPCGKWKVNPCLS